MNMNILNMEVGYYDNCDLCDNEHKSEISIPRGSIAFEISLRNKHVQMIKQKGKGKHLRATEGDDDSEFDIFRPYIIRT